MIISNANKDLLRNHPFRAQFYMTVMADAWADILPSSNVFKHWHGTVSGAHSPGARHILLTSLVGTFTGIQAGATVVVIRNGITISKRRFRSWNAGTSTMTVDENSVSWAANDTVKIYENYGIWPIYPYIDPTTKVFYKDMDVAYGTQNQYPPPVAICGGPKVGFLSGGSLTFTLDASASYAMLPAATITTYKWECSAGTIANSNIAVTSIVFTDIYLGWIKLTVTDSHGTTQVTYRAVAVHDGLDDADTFKPVTAFEVQSLTGDRNSGGWELVVKMYANATDDMIPDGALVVLWNKIEFRTLHSLGETYMGESGNLRFVGYVVGKQVHSSSTESYITVTIASISKALDKYQMCSLAIEEADVVDKWYTVPPRTLTVARALHYLWKWHSTLLEIADVYFPMSDVNTMPACDDMESSTLYSMANFAYENGNFSKAVCNRAGVIYAEVDILMLDVTDRGNVDEAMIVTTADRLADPSVEYTIVADRISGVIASGYGYAAGVYAPIMANAPVGIAPDVRGIGIATLERLVLADQAHLNMIAGRLYALSNREIQEFRVGFASDYPIDLAPQYWWRMDVGVPETIRNLHVVGNYVVTDISDNVDVAAGTVTQTCAFTPDVESVDGVLYTYPEDPEPPESPKPPYTPPGSGGSTAIIKTVTGTFGWSFVIQTSLTGVAGYIEIPYNCILTQVSLVGDASGSCVIDIWMDTYGNFPPTVADSITGGSPPALVSARKYQNAVLTGWTKSLLVGRWLGFNVNSASGISQVTLAMKGIK